MSTLASPTAAAAPSTPPVPSAGAVHGMTPEQLAVVAEARRRARKVSRAASVATFSGWAIALCAAPTLIGGLFGLPSLLLGLALSFVAWCELRGAQGLRTFDARAPRRLALNQLVLAGAVTAYAAWGLLTALVGPSPYEAELAAGGPVAEAIAPIAELHQAVMAAFYVAVAVGALVAQGCMAAYYASRRRHLDRFRRETPDWVRDTLRVAAGGAV